MTNNTPDLLPCPFNHKHELERYITGDGTMVSCCSCGIEMHVDQWNTRTPNKNAEVDLERLKREVRGEKEKRYDMDYTYDLGWNAALEAVRSSSGHLATGKGGDDKPVIGMIGHVDSNKTALTAAIRMVTEQQKTAEPCGDEPHPCACKFKDDECIDPCAYHVDLEAGYKQLKKINDELGIKLAKWHNEKIGFTAAPTQIDAGELDKAIADLQSRLNISSEITINEGMPLKVNGLSQLSAERLLQAARAHLDKLKGGV